MFSIVLIPNMIMIYGKTVSNFLIICNTADLYKQYFHQEIKYTQCLKKKPIQCCGYSMEKLVLFRFSWVRIKSTVSEMSKMNDVCRQNSMNCVSAN